MTDEVGTGSRVARWRGLIGLAGRRVFGRATEQSTNRVSLAILIVALAVALLVVVTGISVGLASQSTVYGNDVDYWVVPESGTSLTTVVSVQGPQLGAVHTRSNEIESIAGVSASTPVLIDVIRMRGPESESPEFILGVGIIPEQGAMTDLGVPTRPLTPSDPYYADGTYDGEFTGEVVLTPAAASLLNASAGEDLVVGSPASGDVRYSDFSVTAVSDSGMRTFGGDVPVAVVHLSELQSVTGAASDDQADQILVRTNSPDVKANLEEMYPSGNVVAREGLNLQQVVDSDLPLAIAVTALIVGLVVAGLFVATTMGLEVEADREFLMILEAIGVTSRGRLLVVSVTTIAIAMCGGVLGTILGFGGILGLNLVLTTQFGMPAVAQLHPLLVLYALLVALGIGVLSTPYPVIVARKTETREGLL
jgi:putative ABC transport system permease protein